ncbi:hypothetical protein [Pseudomonas tussilaginis]|uniref:hypothetical protein n=1 Tax=Pseudomonas putida TaxID=303 RepID=UPI002364A2F0|nr:hypothetical protein [Pseudomonas putida]MDD1976961.1 hypothetical protein [Pseudomonas putida]
MRTLAVSAAGLAMVLSSVAMGEPSNKQQREKIDRCSNAAYLALMVIEASSDPEMHPSFISTAMAALKKNPSTGKAMPYEGEVVGAYTVALKLSEGLPRPFDKRGHDWLIAQAASTCTLWVPYPEQG